MVIHFYRCRVAGGMVEPRESQEMAWVAPDQLESYPFPAADRALIRRLRAHQA